MSAKKFAARAPVVHGIAIKKQYGQHFLRDQAIVDHMMGDIPWDQYHRVMEIGCGDGFLTRSLLTLPVDAVRVYELDPEWGTYVQTTYPDDRLQVCIQNVLDVSVAQVAAGSPWVLLANLPYVVTFPILYWMRERQQYIPRGVIMIQEEVAQRLCARTGREYGFVSVYFQHFFSFRLLDKVPPTAFVPPPKVTSRLVAFSMRTDVPHIAEISDFWIFVKRCFAQPRRMLRNNLAGFGYRLERITQSLDLRAQQLEPERLIALWHRLIEA